MEAQRLQKIIAEAGIASRREAERLIEAGRVTVNGRVALLGEKADPDTDDIRVDGIPVRSDMTRTYLMLHKPAGYVTTLSDERGRPTVAELVSGCGARVWPVGRLDLDSEGLLLLTDDGELTNHLTHPRHEIDKEYHVTVKGNVEEALPVLSAPMELDGVPLRPAVVRQIGWEGKRPVLSVIIHEGKNRQVRRMCTNAGLEVLRLIRVREGSLLLGGLEEGAWRYLTKEEVQNLLK